MRYEGKICSTLEKQKEGVLEFGQEQRRKISSQHSVAWAWMQEMESMLKEWKQSGVLEQDTKRGQGLCRLQGPE